jgi:hypothetical protein
MGEFSACVVSVGREPRLPGGGRRATRMPEGKVPVTEDVGVEGGKTTTLPLVWGDLEMARECVLRDGEAIELEDVVDARERECW